MAVFFITTAETSCMKFFLVFAEMLSWPLVLSVVSCLLTQRGVWHYGKQVPENGPRVLNVSHWQSSNQESLCTPSSLISLFCYCLTSEKTCELEGRYRWLMRQKEFLIGNQKKAPNKQKGNPTHCFCKASPPTAVSAGSPWQGSGWCRSLRWCMVVFLCFSICSFSSCITEKTCNVCVVRFHQRSRSSNKEVVS